MDKIIIEARVNELAPRDENPNVPFTPEDTRREVSFTSDAPPMARPTTTRSSIRRPTPAFAKRARS